MRKEVFDTTLGELIVAITEATGHATIQRRNTYNVVSCILAYLLRHKRLRFKALDDEIVRALSEEGEIIF